MKTQTDMRDILDPPSHASSPRSVKKRERKRTKVAETAAREISGLVKRERARRNPERKKRMRGCLAAWKAESKERRTRSAKRRPRGSSWE